MNPTLEPVGPYLAPVDETGTVTGPLEPETSREDRLEAALRRLYVEALRYRDTGRGREYLTNALLDTRELLEAGVENPTP